jgi:hypothetical protein
MINKRLENITKEDLEDLIKNSVAEGKTIEYKLDFPGSSDSDKKEFLADVSSFSNTLGGDLIFGLGAKNGLPTEIKGVEVEDLDGEIGKYENIIRDGIEPRIRYSVHTLKLADKKVIFIFRMDRSWLSPHRVIFKGHDKFYARNSTGKYPLDTSQLRSVFLLSETLTDKINKFKIERIEKIVAGDTPVPLDENANIILHIIPLGSQSNEYNLNPTGIDSSKIPPMSHYQGWDSRINFEGFLTYTSGATGNPYSYVQVYRNGIIEAVDNLILRQDRPGEKYIPYYAYEKSLLESLKIYIDLLKNLDVKTPLIVFLTLTGVRGFSMEVGPGVFRSGSSTIDRDILQLPEAFVETFDTGEKEILRPMFDLIWNACGRSGSTNFDEKGNWINQ